KNFLVQTSFHGMEEAMGRISARMVLAAGASLAALLGAAASAQEGGHTVTVTAEGLRSDAGTVMAVLCDNASIFCATYSAVAEPSPEGSLLVFAGVAPGRYVFAAFHDENGDGQ